MIVIKDLTLKFGKSIIFENAEIKIPKNKITIITGLNGIGKTSLLKVLNGEIFSNCGISGLTKSIFYLPQKIDYTKGLTVFEYLSSHFYKNSYKWFLNREEKEEIENILKKMELIDKKDISIEKLSAGELQKVNIALGLLSKADLILLDEPTSNLDLVNQIKILDMIKTLALSNITCVIVMHDLNLALKYGDYFIGITTGHKIIQADKEKFFKEDILKKIYRINFQVVNDKKTVIGINY